MIKIGIVCQDQPEGKFGTSKDYMDFVYSIRDDIIPVPLPPLNWNEYKEFFKLDGILLPGGMDVNPTRYGERPSVFCGPSNPYLEYFDNYILPNIYGKLAIFGICRGLQSLNVYSGGTLFQHLHWHKYSTHERDFVHKVFISNDLKDYRKKNSGVLSVNSYHHQAIKLIDLNKLTIEGISEDGFVEAVSNFRNRVFAVQWHPERMKDDEYSMNNFRKILS